MKTFIFLSAFMFLTTTESSFAAESSKHDPNYDPNYTRTFEQDSAPTPSQGDPEEEYIKVAQSNKFPENFENAIKLSNSNNINYKNIGAEILSGMIMDKNFPKDKKLQAFQAIEKNTAAMGWDKNFIESLRKSMDSN